MDTTRTDLTLVLDRSGSMQSIRAAMEESLTAMLARQAAAPGRLVVSLVRFDDVIETAFTAVPAEAVPPIRIEPRGCTALLDALGSTIDATGARLSDLPEAERPGCVIVVVVTDGLENASRRFTRADVQQRIRHQRDAYQWQFVFLGANIDAVETAKDFDIADYDALTIQQDLMGIEDAIESLDRGIAAKRHHAVHATVSPPPRTFSEADRAKQIR